MEADNDRKRLTRKRRKVELSERDKLLDELALCFALSALDRLLERRANGPEKFTLKKVRKARRKK